MSEAAYSKPLPSPSAESQPFWDACRRHELRLQRCADCGEIRFPPGPMCPACHSMRDEWVRMQGTGTIYSWVVVYPPVLPAFAAASHVSLTAPSLGASASI